MHNFHECYISYRVTEQFKKVEEKKTFAKCLSRESCMLAYRVETRTLNTHRLHPQPSTCPSLRVHFSDIDVFPIRSFVFALRRRVGGPFVGEGKQQRVWLQRRQVQLLRL